MVAITGVYGAGKTTVAEMFRSRGIPVVSSDALAHELLADQKVAERVGRLFGPEALNPDGTVNRAEVARRVFRSDVSRRRLERIVHPLVFRRIRKAALDAARKGCTIVAVEIPLLHETHAEQRFDTVVTVHTPAPLILKRLKRFCPPREVRARWKAQMPAGEKARRADWVIDNSGPRNRTMRQVDAVLRGLALRYKTIWTAVPASGRRKIRWSNRAAN